MQNLDKKEVVKILKNIAVNETPLDDEEKKELEDWKNIKESDIELCLADEDKEFANSFKSAQEDYKKSKQITIRIETPTLNKIKNKAANYGLNYQTYINLFLYQLANDKFTIELR